MKLILLLVALAVILGCADEERNEISYHRTFDNITSSPNPYLEFIDIEGSKEGPFALVKTVTFRANADPNYRFETENGMHEYLYDVEETKTTKEARFHWQLLAYVSKQEESLFILMKLHEGWDSFEPVGTGQPM